MPRRRYIEVKKTFRVRIVRPEEGVYTVHIGDEQPFATIVLKPGYGLRPYPCKGKGINEAQLKILQYALEIVKDIDPRVIMSEFDVEVTLKEEDGVPVILMWKKGID